jgi:hypothetical protein
MSTEVEGSNCSNSSLNMASLIIPISPLKPETYYNTAISGCGKRCPCRGWVNCPAYVDITEQIIRLKNKSDKDYGSIHEWYDTNFRNKYEYCDIFGNG